MYAEKSNGVTPSPEKEAARLYKKSSKLFADVFFKLSSPDQEDYLKKIYANKKYALLDAILPDLNSDSIDRYAYRSYKDKNLSFFKRLIPYLRTNTRSDLLKQARKDKRIAFINALK